MGQVDRFGSDPVHHHLNPKRQRKKTLILNGRSRTKRFFSQWQHYSTKHHETKKISHLRPPHVNPATRLTNPATPLSNSAMPLMNPTKPLANPARALTNSVKRVVVTHEFGDVQPWLTNPASHNLIQWCYGFETDNLTVEGDQKRKRRNIPWFDGNRKSLLSSLLDLWKSTGLVTIWYFIFVDGFYGVNVDFVGGFAVVFFLLRFFLKLSFKFSSLLISVEILLFFLDLQWWEFICCLVTKLDIKLATFWNMRFCFDQLV